MDWTDAAAAAAIYASIVATAALALEVRRWFETGPRLTLTLLPEAKIFGTSIPDHNTYLHVRVTNRGTMPTTISNFGLEEYRSIFHRFAMKASKSAIVPNPLNGPPLPYVLQHGTEWAGSTTYDHELREWAESGRLFAAIYHSYSSRPIQRKVVLAPKKDAAGEEEQ